MIHSHSSDEGYRKAIDLYVATYKKKKHVFTLINLIMIAILGLFVFSLFSNGLSNGWETTFPLTRESWMSLLTIGATYLFIQVLTWTMKWVLKKSLTSQKDSIITFEANAVQFDYNNQSRRILYSSIDKIVETEELTLLFVNHYNSMAFIETKALQDHHIDIYSYLKH